MTAKKCTLFTNKQYIVINNFLSLIDQQKMLQDIKNNFDNNIHEDRLSGLQTKPDLHIVNTGKHWNNFFNKLNVIMKKFNKTNIQKCWALKINKKQDPYYHRHRNTITSVYYLQNDDKNLGTYFKEIDVLIPGIENSIVVFEGSILHDAVFPEKNLTKPRYTLITDY